MVAVIDIGSNSVRINVYSNGIVIFRGKINSRLGEGLNSSKVLLAEPKKRTFKALELLMENAKTLGCQKFFAFATEAVRRANDGKEFLDEIEQKIGLKVELLSGDIEADIGLIGALSNKDGAILDVGGASSELAVRQNGKKVYSKSLPVGAGILFDSFCDEKKPLENFCQKMVKEYGVVPKIEKLVGIGGTATSIAYCLLNLSEYSPEKTHEFYVSKNALKDLLERLQNLSVEDRILTFRLSENRAKVIFSGATFVLEVLNYLSLDGYFVSEKDNLDGYLEILKRGGKIEN